MKKYLVTSLFAFAFMSPVHAKNKGEIQDIQTVAAELEAKGHANLSELSIEDSECRSVNGSSRHLICAINFNADREDYGYLVDTFFGEPEWDVIDTILDEDFNGHVWFFGEER